MSKRRSYQEGHVSSNKIIIKKENKTIIESSEFNLVSNTPGDEAVGNSRKPSISSFRTYKNLNLQAFIIFFG